MNILGFFKSIFNPKIPTEYYVLKQTQPGIFKVETRDFATQKTPYQYWSTK